MSQMDDPAGKLKEIIHSPSYRVAYEDVDFLREPRLRPVRMQLELQKAELSLREHRIRSTIVVFGSTQIVSPPEAQKRLERARERLSDTPGDLRRQRAVARLERLAAKSPYYEIAREFASLVSREGQSGKDNYYVICTGGGPGIMEAANRGAYDVGAKSIGLNIRLPKEQAPNPYITPDLCFQFHYFALRKMHFLLRAKALVVFPGGFGTCDELFDALTLRQTGRMQHIPIILFGRKYWNSVLNFRMFADEGTIEDEDLDLFRYVDTPREAWNSILEFHQKVS